MKGSESHFPSSCGLFGRLENRGKYWFLSVKGRDGIPFSPHVVSCLVV